MRVSALFEANEIIDAHPGQRGHLFSAQAWCPSPSGARWQADVGRLQLLATGAEELGQRCHPTSMPCTATFTLALAVPG